MNALGGDRILGCSQVARQRREESTGLGTKIRVRRLGQRHRGEQHDQRARPQHTSSVTHRSLLRRGEAVVARAYGLVGAHG